MNTIYSGQSSLALRVYTGIALNDAESCEIRFTKPDGTGGAFAAVVLDAAEGLLGYDVADGDIDMSGHWRFWAWVGFPGGRSAPGRCCRVFVRKEGR